MALQLNLETSNVGLPAPEAYAKIVAYSFNAAQGKIDVYVDIWANRDARVAGKAPIDGGVFGGAPGSDGPNLDANLPDGARSELYAWLKTLPKFQGAVDVLNDPQPLPAEPLPPIVEPAPVVEPEPTPAP